MESDKELSSRKVSSPSVFHPFPSVAMRCEVGSLEVETDKSKPAVRQRNRRRADRSFDDDDEEEAEEDGSSTQTTLTSPRKKKKKKKRKEKVEVRACVLCKKECSTAHQLHQHMQTFHVVAVPLECAKCGKRYPTEKSFAVHKTRYCGGVRTNNISSFERRCAATWAKIEKLQRNANGQSTGEEEKPKKRKYKKRQKPNVSTADALAVPEIQGPAKKSARTAAILKEKAEQKKQQQTYLPYAAKCPSQQRLWNSLMAFKKNAQFSDTFAAPLVSTQVVSTQACLDEIKAKTEREKTKKQAAQHGATGKNHSVTAKMDSSNKLTTLRTNNGQKGIWRAVKAEPSECEGTSEYQAAIETEIVWTAQNIKSEETSEPVSAETLMSAIS